MVTTAAQCTGVWKGAGTVCEPNPCPPPPPFGACCFQNAACRILDRTRCERLRGHYLGDGTVCNPNPCNPSKSPNGPTEVESSVKVKEQRTSWGQIKSLYR